MNNPLLKLLALNKGLGQFKAEHNDNSATLYLYDVIVSDDYYGGVSALTFAKELNAIDAPEIHLRLDSPGGDVFAARAMVQAIKEHKSKIIVHIDGKAASAATFLVIAADESIIAKGAEFMIHKAWTFAGGNAHDFAKMAELLDRVDQTLVDDYAEKTGKEVDELRDLMTAETYYFGNEAVEAGFVDKLADSDVENHIKWDMSAYKDDLKVENSPQQPNKQLPDEPDPAPVEEITNLDHLRRRLALVEKAA